MLAVPEMHLNGILYRLDCPLAPVPACSLLKECESRVPEEISSGGAVSFVSSFGILLIAYSHYYGMSGVSLHMCINLSILQKLKTCYSLICIYR